MDCSPAPFDRAEEARAPAGLAVLMVGVAARQAASVTAAAQAGLGTDGEGAPTGVPGRFAPADGRFSAATARAITDWKDA